MYDHRATKYDDSPHPRFASYMLSRALEAPSPLSENPLLLDLACGTGLVTIPALDSAPPNAHIYGIDLSPGMLEVARNKIATLPQEQQGRIHYIKHDITHLSDVPELHKLQGKFDVATCASAFVLLSDPRKAIAEWSKWIRPGGRLVVDATHPHNLRAGTVMQDVSRKMGIQLPYDRSWSTSEQAFIDVVQSGGHFEVQDLQLVQMSGEGTKFLDPGHEEADRQFARLAQGKTYESLTKDDETREKAEILFREEWAAGANPDGKVEDVDGVWVIVAKRSMN